MGRMLLARMRAVDTRAFVASDRNTTIMTQVLAVLALIATPRFMMLLVISVDMVSLCHLTFTGHDVCSRLSCVG